MRAIEIFREISAIPRCSKDEARIIQYLLDWAENRGLTAKRDKVGNVLILVPATEGYEDAPTVILQGHLDMVCEKTPQSKHDFSCDPIKILEKDGWLTAEGTSLGADNGIAIAYALAIAEADDIAHPELELLFTVDEETGLVGAVSLEGDFLKGRILLNIDSEEEGIFTLGCAGGRDTRIRLPLRQTVNNDEKWQIEVGGLLGGHSGMNIGEGRANAIQILARLLNSVPVTSIAKFEGGSAHNAIPRDGRTVFSLPPGQDWLSPLMETADSIKSEYGSVEKSMTISIRKIDYDGVLYQDPRRTIDLLLALPHGVFARDNEGSVETSNNLARVSTGEDGLDVLLSQRSSRSSALDFLTWKIEAIAHLAEANFESNTGYPAWQPDMESRILDLAKKVYRRLTGKQAETLVIHAGLECGIIGAKFPGMDMISLGPDIRYPHSPDEKANVASIGRTWDFLLALLGSIKEY